MQPKLATRCTALLLATATHLAADQTWTGATGDWAIGTNWSTGVPNIETAIVNNGGTAQIGSAVPNINWLWNNNNSSVQVNSGGAIRVTGDIDNFGGSLTVNNGGSLTLTGGVLEGGTTVVNTGGTLNVGASDDLSWGRIGNGGFGTTNFSIAGGTVNAQFTEGDGLVLGDFEHTTNFNMSAGGTLNMAGKGLKIGWWKAGNATLTADASTINFTQDGSVEIGAGNDTVTATGAMILQNGTSLTKIAADGGGNFIIGNNWGDKGNTGSLTVSTGATIDWQRGEFIVGNGLGSIGTMTLNGGTVTTHSWTPVSRDRANGHLIINGGTMNVLGDTGGYLQVVAGAGGTGVIDINGGTLNVTAGGGTVRFQDWDWTTGESWGTINLNGGRLIAGDIARKVGTATDVHAVFNFNGGILQPIGGNILHDLESVFVKSGGAIIDSAGNGGTDVNMPLLNGGGGGGLVIRGNGTDGGDNDRVYLRNDNTFTGGLTIEHGAYVNLTGSGDESGVAGTGNITLNGGGFKNWNGSNPTLSRQITLGPGGGYFTIGWGNNQITVSGNLTGAGGLFVNRDGGHLLVTNPANDYSGDTRLGADGPGRYSGGDQAGLYLGADEVIPDGPGRGNLIIDGGYGGHLNMNGHHETINGLSDINGGRVYNSGAAATLTVGNNNATSVYNGQIEDAISLQKTGDGTLTLGGTNTYTGATSVSAGTLLVNGSLGNTAVTVANAATIGGQGAINGTLSFGGNSFFDVFMAVSNNDPLAVAGTVSFGSGFGIDNLKGVAWDTVAPGSYTILASSQDFSAAGLDNWTSANAVTVGTLGRMAYFENGSLKLTIVIPEPSTAILAGLASLGLALRRRRHQPLATHDH